MDVGRPSWQRCQLWAGPAPGQARGFGRSAAWGAEQRDGPTPLTTRGPPRRGAAAPPHKQSAETGGGVHAVIKARPSMSASWGSQAREGNRVRSAAAPQCSSVSAGLSFRLPPFQFRTFYWIAGSKADCGGRRWVRGEPTCTPPSMRSGRRIHARRRVSRESGTAVAALSGGGVWRCDGSPSLLIGVRCTREMQAGRA